LLGCPLQGRMPCGRCVNYLPASVGDDEE
jgi:hypothetical protein